MSAAIELTPGVTKKILTKGDDQGKPEQGQEVLVNYEGRLTSGTVFDSSYDKEALKVVIGVGQVIKGWDIGIMSMTLGEKAELTIAADHAYGALGSPPSIPSHATLIFTVELLSINNRRPTRWMMSDGELIQVAMRLKEDGNAKFRLGEFKAAEGYYRDAASHLDTVKNSNNELRDLMIALLQNTAVCCNKASDYKEAIKLCTRAISLDSTKAVKAWMHRSVANLKCHNFDEATADCREAIKLNPKEKSYRDHWELIKKEKLAKQQSQKQLMQKLFSEGVYNEKEDTKIDKVLDKLPAFNKENPQVFFDLKIHDEKMPEEQQTQRVVFELFKDVPKTCENFRGLCTGDYGGQGLGLHYKSNRFHRLIKGFMMQGGDTTNGNGTGGKSIYGDKFNDEKIWYPHTHKGLLSMANAGANTNGSQFFLCFAAAPHLNQKHTVFGRVIKGYEHVAICEDIETGAQDKPLTPVEIVDCGELRTDKLTGDEPDVASFLKMYQE